MRPIQRIGFAIGVLGVVSCIMACCCVIPAGSASNEKPKATDAEQAERKSAIETAQSEGIIGEVASQGDIATVMVTQKFKDLSAKEKNSFAVVIRAWAFKLSKEGLHAGEGGTLQFIDKATGKVYATCTHSDGFRTKD